MADGKTNMIDQLVGVGIAAVYGDTKSAQRTAATEIMASVLKEGLDGEIATYYPNAKAAALAAAIKVKVDAMPVKEEQLKRAKDELLKDSKTVDPWKTGAVDDANAAIQAKIGLNNTTADTARKAITDAYAPFGIADAGDLLQAAIKAQFDEEAKSIPGGAGGVKGKAKWSQIAMKALKDVEADVKKANKVAPKITQAMTDTADQLVLEMIDALEKRKEVIVAKKAKDDLDKDASDDDKKKATKAVTEAEEEASKAEKKAKETHDDKRKKLDSGDEKSAFDRVVQARIDDSAGDLKDLWKDVGKESKLGDLGKKIATDSVSTFIGVKSEHTREMGGASGGSSKEKGEGGPGMAMTLTALGAGAAAVGLLTVGRETDAQTGEKKPTSLFRKVAAVLLGVIGVGIIVAAARGEGQTWAEKVRSGVPGAGMVMK